MMTRSEKAEGTDFLVPIVFRDVGAISLEERKQRVNEPRGLPTNIR
jgi:hypothetical protein